MQKEAQSRGKITNYLQKIGTVFCYIFVVLAALCITVPIGAYNYLKHEVAIGEFGYDIEEVVDPMEEKIQKPFEETPI